MAKDSAARIELGRSFHQVGTVNEKIFKNELLHQLHSPLKDLQNNIEVVGIRQKMSELHRLNR